MRRKHVALSPWADALAALRELPPTRVATVASLPRAVPAQSAAVALNSGASFAASLLDKPSGAPDPPAAVHRCELVAGPCRVTRGLRRP